MLLLKNKFVSQTGTCVTKVSYILSRGKFRDAKNVFSQWKSDEIFSHRRPSGDPRMRQR